jgi:hypothetical protein
VQSQIAQNRGFIMQHRLDASDVLSASDDHRPMPERPRREIAQLPGNAAQLIGERIRAMYAKLACAPVPDRLLDLIRQLENKEPSE